jgi:hypothetical protein
MYDANVIYAEYYNNKITDLSSWYFCSQHPIYQNIGTLP